MKHLERWRRSLAGYLGAGKTGEGVRLRQEVVRCYEAGRYGEAAEAAGRLLELQRNELGEGHPDYATGLSNLALLLQKQGDTAGAARLLEQALAIRRVALGTDHPETARAESLLSSLRAPEPEPDPDPAPPPDDRAERALAVLDGVLALAYLGPGDLAELRACQEAARGLRGEVAEGRAGDGAASLAEGGHPLAALVGMVERLGTLSDAEWASLYETVGSALGRPLARAVSRGQVKVSR